VKVRRKEDRRRERVQVLGLHVQRKSHGRDTHARGSEEGGQGGGMDERDMEEERKDIEREGCGKILKILFVDFFNA
jgi:hypothetical protein